MYVCICNAIRTRQIEAAIAAGAETPSEVFRFVGCKPQCGKCIPDIVEMIRQDAKIKPLAMSQAA